MGITQSKIMEKATENSRLKSELEKVKRGNSNFESKIKELSVQLSEMSAKYKQLEVKYTSTCESERQLKLNNESLNTELKESQMRADLVESKYSGIEVRYNTLNEEYIQVKKDYDKSVQTLEEINKARNEVFDDNHKKDKQIKQLSSDVEDLTHKLYNEQMLTERLQQRLKDLEVEYENLSRIETANSQMSTIQIAALESKYLGMYKKFKGEQKLKNNWIQNYQEQYNKSLQNEIDLKQLEVNFSGQTNRNKDLESTIAELEYKIIDLERRLDLVADEK